jgi:uncharacterized protein YjiS (DUF1127 family)
MECETRGQLLGDAAAVEGLGSVRGGTMPRKSPAWAACWAALQRFRTTLRLWRARSRQRMALARLDAHTLRDIGVTRYDVWREERKWFWQP